MSPAMMSEQALADAIATLPRERVAFLPTPLEECPRLSQALGATRILMKRDDLTGLAFGGNKGRHLEFRMGDVKAKGCDVYINVNRWESNDARIMAAACAKLGVRYVLVVRGGAGKPMEANLLLEHLMGAEIHPLETMDRDETNQEAERIGLQLQEEGYTPYVYHQQPFARVAGTIGYLEATVELAAQLAERNIHPDYIYGVAGTSMAGIALATKLLGYPWKVRAISSGDRRNLGNMMLEYGQEVQDILGLPDCLQPDDFGYWDEYIGGEYAVSTPDSARAIKLAAETEALILDPVYTGKALAGLMDHIDQGLVDSSDTVVFVHTGGLPNLFASTFRESLSDAIGSG